MAVDKYYFDTTLLMSFDGMEGATVFEDRSPFKHKVTRVGDAKITLAYSKFGGGSVAFDGNGDYLQIANPAIDVAANDFTIEGWARSTGTTGSRVIIARGNNGTLVAANFQYLIYWAADKLAVQVFTGSTTLLSTSTADAKNDGGFHHFALVREGTTYYFFVDGLIVGTVSSAAVPNTASNFTTYIGSAGPGAALWNDGHIEDLRVTRNIARYTTKFVPPTAAFSITDADNVSLLLHMDGANNSVNFVDSSLTPKTVGVLGNAKMTTTAPKFDSSCAIFDGAGDALWLADDPSLDLSTGDFTVELYVKNSTAGVAHYLLCRSKEDATVNTLTRPNLQVYIAFSAGNLLSFNAAYGGTANNAIAIASAVGYRDGNWHHVAFCREGDVFSGWVDGTCVAQMQGPAGVVLNTGPWKTWIGGAGCDPYQWTNGSIDEVRITKGVARYSKDQKTLAANDVDMLPVDPVSKPQGRAAVEAGAFTMAVKPAAAVPALRDMYHAGKGRIAGTVAEASSPTDRPVSRKVRLHRKRDGLMVRETWSKADGTYSFENIENAQDYYVVSFDHTQTYNAAIKDAITPELAP